ncbi:hypothetical protein [Stenotrophomonas maltophilia]|uniref:hypothetical protein n=1 Tax=Stenotrophomonas maltophilia TaxID=40324 RepID=UPI001304495F|nr:hypothetical protein [Stenotrophomonas maltophilia]
MNSSPDRKPLNASRDLLAAARHELSGPAPSLHEYRMRGLEAAQRLNDRPRPR